LISFAVISNLLSSRLLLLIGGFSSPEGAIYEICPGGFHLGII
jgi:hypothetical protein